MNTVRLFMLLFASISSTAVAQSSTAATAPGSRARSLDPASDPVNQFVRATTVDALLISLHIDAKSIALTDVQVARIPKPRERKPATGTDTITVTASSGGAISGRVVVGDPSWLIEEGAGMRRIEQRDVRLALPTPKPVDSIEVKVAASGVTQKFDVTAAYKAPR